MQALLVCTVDPFRSYSILDICFAFASAAPTSAAGHLAVCLVEEH